MAWWPRSRGVERCGYLPLAAIALWSSPFDCARRAMQAHLRDPGAEIESILPYSASSHQATRPRSRPPHLPPVLDWIGKYGVVSQAYWTGVAGGFSPFAGVVSREIRCSLLRGRCAALS